MVKESYYENSKSTGVHRSMPAAFGRGISNVHIREELNCRSVKKCLDSRSVVPVNWTKSIAERKQPTKEKTSYKIMGEDRKDAMVNADTSSGNVKEKKMAAGSGNSGTTYIEETTEVIAPDTKWNCRNRYVCRESGGRKCVGRFTDTGRVCGQQ